MNINATILIQIISFMIAYCALRFLLCKPAIKTIQKEQATLASLRARIDYSRQSIEEKEQERVEQKKIFYDYCVLHQPLVGPETHLIQPIKMPTYEIPTEQDMQILVDQAARAIFERIQETL